MLSYCDIFLLEDNAVEPKLLTAERFVDMRMGCSYRYIHSTTEYFRPHYHDYYEIFILYDGIAAHLINGERHMLNKGDAVFIRPNDTHDYTCISEEAFKMLNITFTSETAEEIFAFLGEGFGSDELCTSRLPVCVKLSDAYQKELFERMTHIRLIEDNKVAELKSALRILIFKLITEVFSNPSNEVLPEAPFWLCELREKLREDSNFILGIPAISELTDKSREHVARSMKKYFGVTVSEYINDLRLNYIANMLQYSDHNIIDVIFESGFNNVSWCCKCFKKKYGVSMSEYRRQ